jgi:hypothetical protein
MKNTRITCVTAGVLALAASAATADSVYVQDLGPNGNVGRGVAVTLSNGLTFADGSTSGVVWAGQRTLRIDGIDFDLYSAELTGAKGEGWFATQNVSDSLGAIKADAIASLYGAHDNGRFAGREQTVAFQAMLWEIVYDYDGTEGSIDLTSGSVAFGLVKAREFEAFKTSAMRDGSKPALGLISSDPNNDSFRIVPLPSTAGLACLGLLGLAAASHRRA